MTTMIRDFKPKTIEDKQMLLDFQDHRDRPEAFKDKSKRLIYVEHQGYHHVVETDFEVYQLKRKSKPTYSVVVHASYNERAKYFLSIGYLI